MADKKQYCNEQMFSAGSLPVRALYVLLERMVKEWIGSIKPGLADDRTLHSYFLPAYHNASQVKNRLRATSSQGKALCLLKTQFAKKPKNPV